MGPIGNEPVSFQVMAWRQADNKPLSEPVLAQFTNAARGADELNNSASKQLRNSLISLVFFSFAKVIYHCRICNDFRQIHLNVFCYKRLNSQSRRKYNSR